MESKVAQQAERELIEATQRMTPQQRLDAFLQHSQLMTELYLAGRAAPAASSQQSE